MVCYPNLTLCKTYSNFLYKSYRALYALLGSKGREAKFYGYITQIFHHLFSLWLIVQIMHHDSKDSNQTLFCVMVCLFISRLSMIVLVNVVLNRTVAVDTDWRFDTVRYSSSESKRVVSRQLTLLNSCY